MSIEQVTACKMKYIAMSNIYQISVSNSGVNACTTDRVRQGLQSAHFVLILTFYFQFLVIPQAVNQMDLSMLKNFKELYKISVSNCSVRIKPFAHSYAKKAQFICKPKIQICKIHCHRWTQFSRRQRANCPIQNQNVAHFQKQPNEP